MIKVLAFDMVGVLINEKDVNLTNLEEKFERLFGPNISDEEYLEMVYSFNQNEEENIKITKEIINKLYKNKYSNLFESIKEKNPNLKIIIATNHVSFIKDYIKNNFNLDLIDDIIISADIHKIKPNVDFYDELIKICKVSPNEILFFDDNESNIIGAKECNINAFKVNRETNLLKEINNML
jgi:HAD superfamily hydrolase (TIGR01509 family)